MPALSWLGGVLIHLASDPLGTLVKCNAAKVPSGNPSRRSNIVKKVLLTAMDFWVNGMRVSCILAFAVAGYVRCVIWGHDNASS